MVTCGFPIQLGWGLLSQFSPLRYFPHFPLLSKQTLAIEYHVYIWQVSPQHSCGDNCQIWMWFRESNRYFCKIENFAYGEISERSFSNPHPWSMLRKALRRCHVASVGLAHSSLPRYFLCCWFWQLKLFSKQSSCQWNKIPRSCDNEMRCQHLALVWYQGICNHHVNRHSGQQPQA